jgi:lipopolysaccharide transport system ATP-binding protein
MKNVQREGRTVIFVSHQMGMINQLCNHAFFLDNGVLVEENVPSVIIQNYLNHIHQEQNNRFFKAKKNSQDIQIISAETASQSGQSKVQFSHDEDIILKINIYVLHPVENATIGVLLKDYQGRNVFTTQYNLENSQKQSTELQASIKIPGMFLRPGRYSFLAAVHVPNIREIDRVEEICSFMIFDIGSEFSIYSDQSDQGCVFANCQWNIHETSMIV